VLKTQAISSVGYIKSTATDNCALTQANKYQGSPLPTCW
jgi:hypothetical protein